MLLKKEKLFSPKKKAAFKKGEWKISHWGNKEYFMLFSLWKDGYKTVFQNTNDTFLAAANVHKVPMYGNSVSRNRN